ncbi:MAG TPA: hypothetical protein VGW38_10105 [Chloroflexota bacterium]|nr:hypothetical protein [Chloroflexota bacterium]
MNYLRTKHHMHKWTGSQWAYCTGTPYKYRTATGTAGYPLVLEKNWGNELCGWGYYKAWGRADMYFPSSWVGGWLSNGNSSHVLPT